MKEFVPSLWLCRAECAKFAIAIVSHLLVLPLQSILEKRFNLLLCFGMKTPKEAHMLNYPPEIDQK